MHQTTSNACFAALMSQTSDSRRKGDALLARQLSQFVLRRAQLENPDARIAFGGRRELSICLADYAIMLSRACYTATDATFRVARFGKLPRLRQTMGVLAEHRRDELCITVDASMSFFGKMERANFANAASIASSSRCARGGKLLGKTGCCCELRWVTCRLRSTRENVSTTTAAVIVPNDQTHLAGTLGILLVQPSFTMQFARLTRS